MPASPDARFTVSLTGLSVGTYTFGVYAVDSSGIRSVVQTFTITVTGGVNTGISGIFLPPTISLDKSAVRRGEPIMMLGAAAPSSDITVMVHSDNDIVAHATSSAQGIWRYVLDTTSLEMGAHSAQAQAKLSDSISSLSNTAQFSVGTTTVLAPKKTCPARADMNTDCRVNLVDFSIMAYWYKRPLTDVAKNLIDLNHDGQITIIDFSILAFNWTG
jgi:hypothetical protein